MSVNKFNFGICKAVGTPSVEGAMGVETLASHTNDPAAHADYVLKGCIPRVFDETEHLLSKTAHAGEYIRRDEVMLSHYDYLATKDASYTKNSSNYMKEAGVKRHVVTAYVLRQVLDDLGLLSGFKLTDYVPRSAVVTTKSIPQGDTNYFDSLVPSYALLRQLKTTVDADIAAMKNVVIKFENKYNDFLTITDTINADLKAVQADVTEIQADVTEINADLKDVQADVTEINADLKAVQADVTEINAGLKDVQADVTEIQADVTEIQADVTEIKEASGKALVPAYGKNTSADITFTLSATDSSYSATAPISGTVFLSIVSITKQGKTIVRLYVDGTILHEFYAIHSYSGAVDGDGNLIDSTHCFHIQTSFRVREGSSIQVVPLGGNGDTAPKFSHFFVGVAKVIPDETM